MTDSESLHVLIANDDGYDASGLTALHAALSGLARVSVVAPARGVSSAGHGVTDRRPICVQRRHVEPFGTIHIVDALPADCVRLALTELLEHRPDWVVAGINRGGNLGVDVFYSGTVAVAREAAFLGVPAVSVSQYLRAGIDGPDWSRATDWTRSVLKRLFATPPDARPPIWNVNLPSLLPSEEPGGLVVAPMALTPLQIRYRQEGGDPAADGEHYAFAGQYRESIEMPDGPT